MNPISCFSLSLQSDTSCLAHYIPSKTRLLENGNLSCMPLPGAFKPTSSMEGGKFLFHRHWERKWRALFTCLGSNCSTSLGSCFSLPDVRGSENWKFRPVPCLSLICLPAAMIFESSECARLVLSVWNPGTWVLKWSGTAALRPWWANAEDICINDSTEPSSC